MKRTTTRIRMAAKPDFEVPGWEFVVDGVRLVAHRIDKRLGFDESSPEEGWGVTEPLTGCAVPGTLTKTRRAACEAAEKDIRMRGADAFHRMIVKVLHEEKAA